LNYLYIKKFTTSRTKKCNLLVWEVIKVDIRKRNDGLVVLHSLLITREANMHTVLLAGDLPAIVLTLDLERQIRVINEEEEGEEVGI
jgi:hypothetical protein